MNRLLFIGNGLNRLSQQNANWAGLLERLAGHSTTEHEDLIRREKPFTLWFEELASATPSLDLKKIVSEAISESLEPNQLHSAFLGLGYKDIVTTNYDYCLERSLGGDWELASDAPETLYSLFRRHRIQGMSIWHAHGECRAPASIMLGHDQYAGYLHKIRSYLTTGVPTKAKDRNGQPYRSVLAQGKRDGQEPTSWVDLFLERDVDIVGFGLDYTESHIWSLLIDKARKREKLPALGTTTYHRCSDRKQSISDEARLSLLRSLGVNVCDHSDSSYKSAYLKCIDWLRAHPSQS